MTRPQNGMALILVLWLIVLLGIMAAGHSRNAHTDTQLASRQLQSAKARGLAEAGVNHMILEMLATDAGRDIPVDGSVLTRRIGEEVVTIAVRDASGLVDINAASPELLDTALRAAKVDEARRQTLVDAIQDWRDKDDLTHMHGVEDDDYAAAGVAWSSRDSAFAAIDELKYLPGMTQDIFERLAPLVMIHAGRGKTNFDLAPPALAAAARGDAIPSTSGSVAQQAATKRLSAGNGTFHVYASATGSDAVASIEAVVRISRSAEQPFTILEWREPPRQLLPPVPGDEG
jgi:general secretion pathway protein K